MRHTDVAIVGGGLAGSLTAAMLAKAKIDAVLIDPHEVYPPDFRCEKIDAKQWRVLRKAGLADEVLTRMTPNLGVWTARYGRVVEKRPNDQYGAYYQDMVKIARDLVPRGAFISGKVASVTATPERQTLVLSDGEQISARLIVMATGLNNALRASQGMARREISPQHSTSVGFDMAAVGRTEFTFPALDYYPERTIDRIAYLTLFPMKSTIRANLFTYRSARDPWFQELRRNPQEVLFAALPGLKKITGEFAVTSDIQIRPVDLYRTDNVVQPGIVLIGDAFATSCPAAGTGLDKVFTDVERLGNTHIPAWLSSPGMGAEKIGSFYADPVKQACDMNSETYAFHLRALSTENGVTWALRRWARFAFRLGVGTFNHIRSRAGESPRRPPAAEAA